MKNKKNWILGIAPLFALAAMLGKGVIPNEARIALAVIAFTLFAIYVIIFALKKIKRGGDNG